MYRMVSRHDNEESGSRYLILPLFSAVTMALAFFTRRKMSNKTAQVPEPQTKELQLRVIYDPEIEGKGVAEVDLVLVHGFGGDYIDTWTSKQGDSSVFWPKDLLLAEKKQPRTRILSFGYDAGQMVVASIRSYAQSMLSFLNDQREGIESRPVVFLGHCLGGLIVKQAMRFAENDSSFNSIISATRSIMFFGTPHGGGDKKDWEKLASSYKALGPECRMIAVLGKSTNDLTKLDGNFIRLQDRFTINNFLEQRIMKGARKLIVDQTSAAKFPGAGVESVDGDHITMCQFKDAQNNTFMKVCRIIREAVPNEVAVNQLTIHQTPTAPEEPGVFNQQLIVEGRAVIKQELVVGGRVVKTQQVVIDGQTGTRSNHEGTTAAGAVGAPNLQAPIELRGAWATTNRKMLEQKKERNSFEELFDSDPRDNGQKAREVVRESTRSR
ncbi:hypothetical protein GGS24DRAFT_483831 [Hypoxylon argillaceum]|nr:hypothetical protein GGS24DRAFT_483831 [Hypoxylon argillaceum]